MNYKAAVGGAGGTGKGKSCEILGPLMGVEPMSAGFFKRQRAAKLGVSLGELLARVDELSPGLDDEVDGWTQRYGEEHASYLFEGRLAWFFLPNAKRFILICDYEVRVNRIALRERIPYDQALKDTQARERIDAENWKKKYGIDNYLDPAHFDHVIDTTRTTQEEVARQMFELLSKGR